MMVAKSKSTGERIYIDEYVAAGELTPDDIVCQMCGIKLVVVKHSWGPVFEHFQCPHRRKKIPKGCK